MPEPIVATEVAPVVAEVVDPPEAPKPAAGDKTDPWADLPEAFSWARSEVEATRREAGNYRTQLREAQEQLKTAKTPEEIAEITSAIEERATKAERATLIERLARTHSLPEENLEFLTGKTDEELTRQAEKLAKMSAGVVAEVPPVVVTKVPLSGGVTPNDAAAPVDGRAAWRKFRESR